MDEFVKYFLEYKKKVNPVIKEVFGQEKDYVSKIAPLAGQLVGDYKEFLSGGNKLRGCEIFLGYQMFGGENKKIGLKASLVIEIIHSFLLMHDDFMDNDDLRRGKPAMHKKYAEKFGDHYGESLAIVLGDEGCFFAYQLLNRLKISAERLSWATSLLSRTLVEVGIGQALDITYEKEKDLSEEKVLQIHRYKTADYTISTPLSIGAILAGADKRKLKAIKKFGIPVGIAFQLRDDELGMFSTEKQLGKPVNSDLKEGKVTLLIVKALEGASKKDGKFLKYAHGNKCLTRREVRRVREIMKTTGALEYSKLTSRKLVEEGKKFVPQITKDSHFQFLLSQLADFVIERHV